VRVRGLGLVLWSIRIDRLGICATDGIFCGAIVKYACKVDCCHVGEWEIEELAGKKIGSGLLVEVKGSGSREILYKSLFTGRKRLF